jgi:hypothetical protein
MLICVKCRGCGHIGFISKHRLPAWLVCSACGHGATFNGRMTKRPYKPRKMVLTPRQPAPSDEDARWVAYEQGTETVDKNQQVVNGFAPPTRATEQPSLPSIIEAAQLSTDMLRGLLAGDEA